MSVANHKISPSIRLIIAILLFVAADSHFSSLTHRNLPRDSSHTAMSALPPVMLWSWERSDDLRFVDPDRFGIAFLAGTLHLDGDHIVFRPRVNALRFPRGAYLMACVRIESDRNSRPAYSDAQRAQAVEAIAHAAALGGVRALQVDFDARASERQFYSALLTDLRKQLRADVPISITALASWCLGDDWISGLPVEEAVPMLFRMGPDGPRVAGFLADGGDFRTGLCRGSLGLSTDEPLTGLPTARRIYLFDPHPWTKSALEDALAGLGVE